MPRRRQFIAASGALLTGGAVLAAGAASNGRSAARVEPDAIHQIGLDGSGWSMYGGGPGHAAAATWTAGPDDEPSHAWTHDARWGREETRSSQPAVVDGTVFVGLTRVSGNDDDVVGGKVVALDAEDGSERWDYPEGCGGGGFRTPAVVDGTAFVADTVGYVYAVDAETGGHRWMQSVGSGEPTSQLTVADGTVYVTGDRTYALDSSDGEVRWTSEALERPSLWNDRLVGYDVREDEFALVSVETTTGDELWATTLPGYGAGALVESPPPVRDGVAVGVVEGTDEVHAFDVADGTALWDDAGDGVLRPALDDERAYGAYYSGPGVHAHDAETGEEAWSTGTRAVRTVSVADDTLYMVRGSSGQELVALDAATGAERWRRSDWTGEMAVADGTVYLSDEGVVVALR